MKWNIYLKAWIGPQHLIGDKVLYGFGKTGTVTKIKKVNSKYHYYVFYHEKWGSYIGNWYDTPLRISKL